MSPRPLRARMLDLAVMSVCIACIAAPFLPIVHAASGAGGPAVVESGSNVDQKVLEAGIISNPLNGTFQGARSGTVNGSAQWDVYSTARGGIKLLVSSDRSPAMRDPQHGIDVPDAGATPDAWSVPAGERRFGLSANGSIALDRYASGRKWRGFAGTRGVEVARHSGAIARTRTTVALRAEFRAALPDNARPGARVVATAVPNL